jgi:hypothetical protein
MPALDGTGPQGAGPMTGRGMGYCGRNSRGRFYNPAPGFRGVGGLGNRGRGRGWRKRFYGTGIPGWVAPTLDQETADLKAQTDWLKGQLDAIQKCIEEIEPK